MTYVKGIVSNYSDLIANLPSIFCTEDSDWEYIDDRFQSHYGSTFEIPTSDYSIDTGFNDKIAIICDRYLLTDYVQYYSYFAQNHLTDVTRFTNWTHNRKYKSFVQTLKTVFPNASIDVIGDFSLYTGNILNTLDDVISYLNINKPRYLIFNGVEGSLLSGVTYTQCISKLDVINGICANNSIKALLIFTPNYDIMNVNEKEYQEIICTYFSNLEILDIGNWFIHHLELENLSKSSFDTKIANYCDPKYSYFFSIPGTAVIPRYSVVVYNKIKKYVLEKFFGLKRTSFFISFVALTIDKSSYHKTCKYYDNTTTSKIFGRKFTSVTQNTKGLSTELGEWDSILFPMDVNVHFITKYGSDKVWNIFANSGELIQFGIHTSYDESRFMAQQLQCNCSEEFQKARESSGITVNNLMHIRKYATGMVTSELGSLPPPVFPGTGCPWITISERNMADYQESTGRYCPRYVYYSKDRYSYTITVKLHSDVGGKPDLWQSVSVGMMETQKTENYPFPLFACGGTQAVKQDHYQYYPITGGTLTYLKGNSYDLDMDSICLSNSNALHSTKFNGSESSTFKFLTPEGIWQPIWVHSQSMQVLSNPRAGGPPTDYASVLTEPTPTISGVCTIYPNAQESRYTCSVTSKYQELEPYARDNLHNGTRLEKLTIVNESSRTHDSKICVGTLPNLYRSWDDDLPCGEIIIDGVRYLSIPNGWENRLWYYPYHYAIYNDEWQIDTIRNLFSNAVVPKRYKIFTDKLLIKLEDDASDT